MDCFRNNDVDDDDDDDRQSFFIYFQFQPIKQVIEL